MQLLPQVSDVLIIGWKGIEEHFLEEWRKVHSGKADRRIRSVTVVGSTHDGAVEVAYRVVQKVGITPEVTPTFETFSGFVTQQLDDYLRDTLGRPPA